MRGLQAPPKEERPARVFTRFVILVVLVLAAGLTVWVAATDQRIELVEDATLSSLELETLVEVEGLSINVEEAVDGSRPVILLHDADIAGSILLTDVSRRLGDGLRSVLVDLPGFGLSERIPEPGRLHTVSGYAEVVSSIIEERYETSVLVAGVGIGGRVGVEMAATRPELVAGLVLVDVDYWAPDTWEQRVQRLPLVGRAATHTLSTGGRFSSRNWAPHCGEGGWCPTAEFVAERDIRESVVGTTDSVHAFYLTPPVSLGPVGLEQVQVPVEYVWSTDGPVPAESVDRIRERVADMNVTEVDVFQAHLEEPQRVVEAIERLAG